MIPGPLRDRIAALLALVTVICLIFVFLFVSDTRFLMPGPLTSAHSSIENCAACHTKSGSGKLSWLHGLVAGDPLADSQACLACHKMPQTAFNAHSASPHLLNQSTKRLAKLAAKTRAPRSARVQNAVFPTDDKVAHGLYCANCHQEHQGANFTLNKISNEQCRSCHVVKFDSFDGHHPEFENYPFNRRTPIIYDHAGHFGKHFPEVAKSDPARRIPATCSTCHNSKDERRIMAVAPFEQTCSACHLDQIIGKERVSGPKGIAFLSLPALDLQTLKKRKASIGEWPDTSEAELTPFMKVMIGRTERGRVLIKTVDGLNLQDLSRASNEQIRAVTGLAWEIKQLFYTLIKGRASDVLADLKVGNSAKLSANLVADLTANLPRDVVVSAQQQWLPNLAAEMTNRPVAGSAPPQAPPGLEARQAPSKRGPQGVDDAPRSGGAASKADVARTDDGKARSSSDRSTPATTESESDGSENAERSTDREAVRPTAGSQSSKKEAAGNARVDPQACILAVFGQCLVSKGPEGGAGKSAGSARPTDAGSSRADGGKENSSADELPRPSRAGLTELAQATQPEGGKNKPAEERPPNRAADQTDDLLHPTEEELRGTAAPVKDAKRPAAEAGGRGAPAATAKPATPVAPESDTTVPSRAASDSEASAVRAQTRIAPTTSINSDVDAESWAEYGGWYRQDFAILYRPTGHKDKFIHSWLLLTGPHAPKGDKSPPAAVFDLLTAKDAQGACTKCHSVDEVGGRGRLVNFSPPTVESKQGRFTDFIHEPHFGIMENRGCLTCHSLEKDRSYLQSYEQGNPKTFVSNFGPVKKELCQSCHTSGMARQDCLLCHKYHVNRVITPIMSTRNPTE